MSNAQSQPLSSRAPVLAPNAPAVTLHAREAGGVLHQGAVASLVPRAAGHLAPALTFSLGLAAAVVLGCAVRRRHAHAVAARLAQGLCRRSGGARRRDGGGRAARTARTLLPRPRLRRVSQGRLRAPHSPLFGAPPRGRGALRRRVRFCVPAPLSLMALPDACAARLRSPLQAWRRASARSATACTRAPPSTTQSAPAA